MAKRNKSRNWDASKGEDPVVRYSERMAELFAGLAELPPQVAEDGSRRSPEDDARAAELSAEIQRLSHEMYERRERTGRWHKRKQAGTPEDKLRRHQVETGLLRLRKRLCRVADAQVALIAEWNARSAPQERGAFDKEYRRLAKEYSELLAELQRDRERLSNMP